LPMTSWGENPARLHVLADDGGASASSPPWRRRHCSSRRWRLLGQVSERKFLQVTVSTWLASTGVIPFLKATLMHLPHPLRQAPPSLWSSRRLVLPLLFAVVVAWPYSTTDVVLGSTSDSCCRACDALSRMLCRVGFALVLSDVGVAEVVRRRHCLAVLGHRRRSLLHLGQLLPSV
jgi:hypothetical protein